MKKMMRIDPEFESYLHLLRKNIEETTGKKVSDTDLTKFIARTNKNTVIIIKKRGKKRTSIDQGFQMINGF